MTAIPEQPPRFRILIVDDEPAFTSDLSMYLESRYEIATAHSVESALQSAGEWHPDVVLLDIAFGSAADEGFAILEKMRALPRPAEVIMLTGRRDTDAVVRAIKSGAFHYVNKPPVLSELTNLINLAAVRSYGARRLAALESEIKRLGGDLVVRDASMLRVMKNLEKVGPTEATVMISGESGTGKELIARHVHELSRRASGPFIAVNCGAISEQLIESELFGHVRGAFTGAERDRDGCFALARGGTIFLDEIGHAPESLQVKLLRVLENREFQRVGSPEIIPTDVRVVAASSRDLVEHASEGGFREELLFRLNVFRIQLPPLRQRPDDIIPLAEHFLALIAAQTGRRGLEFSPAARDYLLQHPWRGNVRELRNLVERAVILAEDGTIPVQLLAADDEQIPAVLPPYDDAKAVVLQRFQRAYIARALQETEGNVSEAARRTGLARATISRMKGELGLGAP